MSLAAVSGHWLACPRPPNSLEVEPVTKKRQTDKGRRPSDEQTIGSAGGNRFSVFSARRSDIQIFIIS